MFDLIVRNANLPDGRKGIDIGIQGGKIIAVEHNLQAQAGKKSTRPTGWSARPSSIRISTWTPPCRSACRA